jgi:hypothetical protein
LPKIGEFTLPVGSNGFNNLFALRNIYDPDSWDKASWSDPQTPKQDTIPLNQGGFPNFSTIPVFRFKSVTSNPSVAWYAASGTGTFLKLGNTVQAIDKVDACFKILDLANKNGFGQFVKTPVISSRARKTNVHSSKTDPSKEPAFFLFELLCSMGINDGTIPDTNDDTWQFSLSIPDQEILDFVQNEVRLINNFASGNSSTCGLQNTNWRILSNAGSPSVKALLSWYFRQKMVDEPKIFGFVENSMTDLQKLCLHNFFLNVTDPDINLPPLKKVSFTRPARYILNRIANSTSFDFIIRSLILQDNYSSPAVTKDKKPWPGLPIDTVQFTIQANGNSGWNFEVFDYRMNPRPASTWIGDQQVATPQGVAIWNNYAKDNIDGNSTFKFDQHWTSELLIVM